MHITFSDANDPEQMRMRRAFFVGITRVRRSRDLTFERSVTMDFLQRINSASWRQAFNVEAQRVQAMHDATFASVQQYVGDAKWVALLRRLDEHANDGVDVAYC